MKNNRQYFRGNTSESGVALVFALAMLALLLIMLIGFLASAIFEQRIAYNQSGQSITRTIARSAIQRAGTVLAVYDDVADEIPAFAGYGDDGTGTLSADTIRRMTPLSSHNNTGITNMDNDQAFTLIKKLLEARGINPDNYMWDKEIDGKENTPQWIPMIVNVPDRHTHITGRYAYTIIPNLGIEPTLLNKTEPDKRIGGRYKELPFPGLELTSSSWEKVFNKGKWMSLDVLGSRYVLGSSQDPWTSHLDADDAREDFNKKDDTTFMEVVNTFFTTNQDRSVNYDEDRIDLATVTTEAKAQEIAKLISDDNDLINQIAANIKDYVDGDNVPTSDVAPANWLTTAPTYAGNEKTPYINQIVPAVNFVATYNRTYTSTGGGGFLGALSEERTYTQKLSGMKVTGKIYVELVNIYPEDLKASKVVLKGVSASFKDTQARGGNATQLILPGVGGKVQPINFGTLTCSDEIVVKNPEAATITVSKNGYAVLESDEITFTGSITMDDLVLDPYRAMFGEPRLDITVRLDKISFERAVLYDENNKPVDVVKNMSVSDQAFITRALLSDGVEMVFNGENQTRTASLYSNFEVKDPRCNLGNDEEWSDPSLVRSTEAITLVASLNLNAVNKDCGEMKNSDITKEQDLEVAEDPTKVSTACIRNGVMQSVWELGFIHRGKPWQTINLKSADHTKDKTYFNDAVLLDEIAFYDPALTATEKNNEKTQKYNINYPYTHFAAFGPLTRYLKYCPTSDVIVSDDGKIHAAEGTQLSEDQWKDLRKWIAWKCYKSSGGNPSKFDGAENYHFYRHRGYLANVITDWAMNCSTSPYASEKMDAYIEELIAKITPLTRAGDPYEYFTIFAVAQSIKDVGGLGKNKKITRYDRTGTLQEADCQQGVWEPNFDEVTGEIYIIARVRRDLDCQDKETCKEGKHDKDCKYGIHILECYTINEL